MAAPTAGSIRSRITVWFSGVEESESADGFELDEDVSIRNRVDLEVCEQGMQFAQPRFGSVQEKHLREHVDHHVIHPGRAQKLRVGTLDRVRGDAIAEPVSCALAFWPHGNHHEEGGKHK